MTTRGVTWLESNGGPMLLIHTDTAGEWLGTEGPEPWDPENWKALSNDYSRACAVREPVGVIAIRSGWALVFADEPNPITWIPEGEGGVFVRWVHAPEDLNVRSVVAQGLQRLTWTEMAAFPVHGPLLLFDSAFPGKFAEKASLDVSLAEATYRVQTAELKPDAETFLLLHRLIP